MKIKEIRTKSGRRAIFYARRRVAGAKPLQKKSVTMWGVFDTKNEPFEIISLKSMKLHGKITKAFYTSIGGKIRPVTVSWEEKKVK